LRSAQRALQREREKLEEAREEDEVEAVVSPERELGPFEIDGDEEEQEEEGMGDGDEDQEEESEPLPPVIPSVGDPLMIPAGTVIHGSHTPTERAPCAACPSSERFQGQSRRNEEGHSLAVRLESPRGGSIT
jgi:hypothetical protein